jgi:hypothetical protein
MAIALYMNQHVPRAITVGLPYASTLPKRAALVQGGFLLPLLRHSGTGGPAFIRVSLPLFAQNFTLWYDTGRVTAQGWRK